MLCGDGVSAYCLRRNAALSARGLLLACRFIGFRTCPGGVNGTTVFVGSRGAFAYDCNIFSVFLILSPNSAIAYACPHLPCLADGKTVPRCCGRKAPRAHALCARERRGFLRPAHRYLSPRDGGGAADGGIWATPHARPPYPPSWQPQSLPSTPTLYAAKTSKGAFVP